MNIEIEIKVDPEELPNGYSAERVYSDAVTYISIGSGHQRCGYVTDISGGGLPIISIDLDQFEIRIQGGKTLIDRLKPLAYVEYPNAALCYAFEWAYKNNKLFEYVQKLVTHFRKVGYKDGVEEAQAAMRKALGLR